MLSDDSELSEESSASLSKEDGSDEVSDEEDSLADDSGISSGASGRMIGVSP